ncbi:putative gamma-butyrobetaine dioxygenase [Ciona intestinalis]
MDQQIYEYTPGIQIIHALRFDSEVTGGNSQVVDMFEVAETLRKEYPEDFEALTQIPATFNKIDYNGKVPVYFQIQKHHINVDYFGKVVGVNWHPGFLSTPTVREKDMEKYFKAHRKFALILERDDLAGKYNFRMQPGDMLVVNNRRMCHARTSFQLNGGWRHLQACFVNLDDAKSTYMVLAKKLGIKVVPPKVGNTSSI